jgi:hypothetical protein
VRLDWVHLVRRPLFGLLYQPRMIDDDECGTVGGIRIGRGNQSSRKKPAPVPLSRPQISHDLNWDRTWAAAVGNRRLTAWDMVLPCLRFSSRQKDWLFCLRYFFFVPLRESLDNILKITHNCFFSSYHVLRTHSVYHSVLHKKYSWRSAVKQTNN